MLEIDTSTGDVFTAELLARDKVADIALLRIVDSYAIQFHPVNLLQKLPASATLMSSNILV